MLAFEAVSQMIGRVCPARSVASWRGLNGPLYRAPPEGSRRYDAVWPLRDVILDLLRATQSVYWVVMRSARYRWVILAVAFLPIPGALGFGRFGYSTILPSMLEGLGLISAASGSLNSWNLAG